MGTVINLSPTTILNPVPQLFTMEAVALSHAHDVFATFNYMDLTDPSYADPVTFPSDENER